MKAIKIAMNQKNNSLLNEDTIMTVYCPKDFNINVPIPEGCRGIYSLKRTCRECWDNSI